MLNHRSIAGLALFIVLLAACAPATATVSPMQPVTVEASATLLPSPTLVSTPQATAVPVDTLVPTALPIATSRGPNLEVTDPTTVSLASGGLQLVEFFRFT